MHALTTSDAVVDHRTLVRWRNAVIAAFGVGGVTLTIWAPRLPELKTMLDLSTATLGALLAAVTVGSIVGLVASTPVLHWLGSRRALSGVLLSLVGAILVLAASALFSSVALMAVAFVLVGFGVGTLDVLINVEGAAVERTAGRTLMPLMHGAWSVGVAAGSGVGAGCAALGIAPWVQFLGEAVLIAAVAIVIVPAIPAGARGQTPERSQSRRAKIVGWLRGWTDWRLLLIGVVMLGVELGEGSANNWLTVAVRGNHGQSPAIAAVFFTVFAGSEASARIFGGPLIDRLGRVRATRYTTALGVLGAMLFIVGHSPWAALVGVVLWAIGVSMGFPLGMSAAAESGPDPAARVSVVASIGYFANIAGPPVVGALAESIGLLNSLWAIVALLLTAFSSPARCGRVASDGCRVTGVPPCHIGEPRQDGRMTDGCTLRGWGPCHVELRGGARQRHRGRRSHPGRGIQRPYAPSQPGRTAI